MDKFKIKHPTNADFEEKLAKYAKLADDVWRQASITVVMNATMCMFQILLGLICNCILVRLGSKRASHPCRNFLSFD